MSLAEPVRPIIIRRPQCTAHHACWIDDAYWKLRCALSDGHDGNHRGDLGGGLTKTWGDERNWIDLTEHAIVSKKRAAVR